MAELFLIALPLIFIVQCESINEAENIICNYEENEILPKKFIDASSPSVKK